MAVAVVAGLLVLGRAPPAGAAVPTGWATTVTQEGLVQPTSLAFAPDGRLFVAEQRGTIQTYERAGDGTPTLFADLRTVVHSNRDRGLLSIEVDPQWPARPYLYALLRTSLTSHSTVVMAGVASAVILATRAWPGQPPSGLRNEEVAVIASQGSLSSFAVP